MADHLAIIADEPGCLRSVATQKLTMDTDDPAYTAFQADVNPFMVSNLRLGRDKKQVSLVRERWAQLDPVTREALIFHHLMTDDRGGAVQRLTDEIKSRFVALYSPGGYGDDDGGGALDCLHLMLCKGPSGCLSRNPAGRIVDRRFRPGQPSRASHPADGAEPGIGAVRLFRAAFVGQHGGRQPTYNEVVFWFGCYPVIKAGEVRAVVAAGRAIWCVYHTVEKNLAEFGMACMVRPGAVDDWAVADYPAWHNDYYVAAQKTGSAAGGPPRRLKGAEFDAVPDRPFFKRLVAERALDPEILERAISACNKKLLHDPDGGLPFLPDGALKLEYETISAETSSEFSDPPSPADGAYAPESLASDESAATFVTAPLASEAMTESLAGGLSRFEPLGVSQAAATVAGLSTSTQSATPPAQAVVPTGSLSQDQQDPETAVAAADPLAATEGDMDATRPRKRPAATDDHREDDATDTRRVRSRLGCSRDVASAAGGQQESPLLATASASDQFEKQSPIDTAQGLDEAVSDTAVKVDKGKGVDRATIVDLLRYGKVALWALRPPQAPEDAKRFVQSELGSIGEWIEELACERDQNLAVRRYGCGTEDLKERGKAIKAGTEGEWIQRMEARLAAASASQQHGPGSAIGKTEAAEEVAEEVEEALSRFGRGVKLIEEALQMLTPKKKDATGAAGPSGENTD